VSKALLAFVCALAWCVPALAQEARPSRLAIETVASVDESVDERGDFVTGTVLDAVVSADVGAGFEAIVRPFVQRLPSGEWNRQVWVAALRYERRGRVGVRVDAGLIPSPVGLANMMLRPHNNATIALPSSLFTPLPPLELPSTRATLLGVLYPYGINTTVSGTRWDARVAVIDTSPLRSRRVFARSNPPRFTNVVAGAGVTPIVGVRIGASVTHGGWQRAGESPTVETDRDGTVVTVEADFSVRYTRILAEWVRDSLETDTGDVVASGWFAQAQQALTPRWLAAARVERISSPAITPFSTFVDQSFTGTEEIVGYRVTPEITIRAGHRARRGFGRPGFDHLAEVSVVWWKRWM
jgi:hypothetical protein